MNKINHWSKELNRLEEIMEKTNLVKTIKWGSPVYTHKNKNILSFGGFKKYFALWFFNGVFLKDPYKVLLNAQEGKTKALRQWRFISMDGIDEKKIIEYVRKPSGIQKKEKKSNPKSSKRLPFLNYYRKN